MRTATLVCINAEPSYILDNVPKVVAARFQQANPGLQLGVRSSYSYVELVDTEDVTRVKLVLLPADPDVVEYKL